ncbi:MAG: DMT family transporter [Pseudomonadota bacterium]
MSHAAATREAPLPAIGFLMLASLGLFWGLNWPGMKIALGEITIWWFRSMSVCAGAIGLLAISAMAGQRIWPTRVELRPLLICTVFNILGWHICTGYGVSLMPAGRASIIAFTMPVWAAILAVWLLGERMTAYRIAGLVLGMAGLAVLIGPDLAVFDEAPIGALYMLGAATTWATGTVLFKKYDWTSPVAVLIGWQLAIGGTLMMTVAAAVEPVPDPTTWSLKVILALAYLFALPMVYCQWAYFSVVRIFPAGIAAIGTLLVPVVGVVSSALLLGEPIGMAELLSLVLIVSALFVVLVLPNTLRRGDAG